MPTGLIGRMSSLYTHTKCYIDKVIEKADADMYVCVDQNTKTAFFPLGLCPDLFAPLSVKSSGVAWMCYIQELCQ